MLTFKPFTTLLNITLINLHYALRQARYVDVDVEPYAVNRLCLSMRNVRDYFPPKDYHRVETALAAAIENAWRALFCEKNGFNMGVNGRGLGRFSFRPKSPQKGRGHLKH